MNKSATGKLGEFFALKELISLSHAVFKVNYFTKYGEIDLITFDLKERCWVFTEVKTSSYFSKVQPETVLTNLKTAKMLKSIYLFMQQQKKVQTWRIDFIAIKLDKDNKVSTLKHYERIGFQV